MLIAALALMVFQAQAPALTNQTADSMLSEVRAEESDYQQRLIALARHALGTPYVDGPLGEGPGATHDPDPLIDLQRVDCVTYVEQILALAAAEDYNAALDILQKIRYRGGVIDYGARNHFFIADWVKNNRFAMDITGSLGVGLVTETRTIGRRKFFELTKAPEYLDEARDEPLTLAYVPAQSAAEAEANLPSPGLIVFIGKPSWLFASHCGFYIREGDRGLLYHASSVEKKVVAVPFADYVRNNSKVLGYTAYTIDPRQVPAAD